MFRFLATVGSFFLLLGLYFLYGWVAVPKLLPASTSTPIAPLPGVSGPPVEEREDLVPYMGLFAPDDWEREPGANVQLLAVDRTIILFKEDKIEGKIATLKPCTLMFLPDDEKLDDRERIRQAIVLRTPDYAEIEFEGELNFSRFPLPKMQGGRLFGKVTVVGDMKDPGAHDDLFLETENVAFTDAPAMTTISTLRDVRFRFGYNRGEGTMLRLHLTPSDPKKPKSPKTLNLVQFETLKRLNLFFPEESGAIASAPSSVPAAAAAKTAAPNATAPLKPLASDPTASVPTSNLLSDGRHQFSLPTGPATKIDITCQREFSFRPGKVPKSWIAGFMGNVEVVRTNMDGSRDFLNAEELSIDFHPTAPVAAPRSSKPATATRKNDSSEDAFGNLEPVRLEARGRLARGDQPAIPARLTSPQNGGIVMQGDQILYDLKANQLTLETEKLPGASKEVLLTLQNRYQILSETGFRYAAGADGAFGKLESQGRGSLRGNLGDEKTPKNIHLTWNAMIVEPDKLDPKQLLIQLYDGIFADMEGLGKMNAGQMQLWCVVENKTASAGTPAFAPASAKKQMGGNPFGNGGTLVPERAFVMDKVRFENAGGTCDVKRLDIFFETVDPATTRTSQSRWTPQILTQAVPRSESEVPKIVFASTSSERTDNPTNAPIRLVQHVVPRPAPAQTLAPLAASRTLPAPTTTSVPTTPSASPAASRSQHPPASTSVYSQNLLGFQTRDGARSVYAITGDQMKMNVRQDGNRSFVDQLWIGGNVRVLEQIADVSQGDLVEITGEVIHIWNPSSSDTVVKIQGKIPNEAVFKGKGVRINTMEMEIHRTDNKVWINGPGRLLAETSSFGGASSKNGNVAAGPTSLVPLGRQTSKEDGRLLVEWNEQMLFDGKIILFKGVPDRNGGCVRAYYQNQRVVCNIMMLHLNRMFSLFDDKSDEAIEAEVLECAQNVYVQNKQLDEKGELRSFDRAEFDAVRVMLKENYFYASGPGVLRSTFKKSDKGFSGASVGLSAGKAASVGDPNELAFLSIWFHDNIRGNYLGDQKNIEIRGRPVRAAYCPIAGWDDEIDVSNINVAARRGYLLFCERLLVSQMPDPANREKSSMELSAIDNAIIEGEGNDLYGKAQTIRYNQAKSLVILEGDAKINARGSKTSAQRVEYNIESGMFQFSHAGGLHFTP